MPVYEGTTQNSIQIDKSYFSGNRKYHRGRLLRVGRAKHDEEEAKEDKEGERDDTVPLWNEEYCDVELKNIGKDVQQQRCKRSTGVRLKVR